MKRAPAAAVLALAASLGAAACSDPAEPPAASSPVGEALAAVRAHEEERRAATDFTRVPGRHRALGPDPSAIVAAPGHPGAFVVLLRGEDAVALVGPDLSTRGRLAAPALASDLAVLGSSVIAAGEGTSAVARWTIDDGRLVARRPIDLPARTRLRALASHGALAFGVDPTTDALVAFDEQGERAHVPTAAMPIRVAATAAFVVVGSQVGHTLEVFPRDEHGLPAPEPSVRVRRQAPPWGLAATEHEGDLWIAVATAEDAPLDRTVGSFGYVDSVVELHRVRDRRAELVATFLAGEAGLVVPKALALAVDEDAVHLSVAAAGSPRAAHVRWPRAGDVLAVAEVSVRPAPPGTSAALFAEGRVLAACSPLLDALWADGAATVRVPPLRPDLRSDSSRLGEALLTTTLLAPDQTSDGPRSRFTCETCHLDLGIDGRTHATGRDDGTVATTKPLYGLLNNGPHFTRALDRDLTEVAHNEVRVANLGTGVNPWLAIDRARAPWLGDLLGADPDPALFRPAGVRRALVDALADLAHRPNPGVLGRERFTDEERRGAAAFAARCASCHTARLVTDDPATDVPFERWEPLVLSEAGPLVWARDGHEKTGIEPYVHPDGARPTSLRRVAEKRPYFTDGSSPSLDDVLDRARVLPDGGFLHAEGTRPGEALDAAERAALRAFLELL